MARLWGRKGRAVQRAFPTITLNDWTNQALGQFSYGNDQYPLLMNSSMGINPQEEPPHDYLGYIGYLQQAYRSNGVVFACMLARMLHFAEARFMFQEMPQGRPGELNWTNALDIVEHPWPKGQTGDLLARAIQDVDLSGNNYLARKAKQLYRLRPDWTTIIMGSNTDPDAPAYAWDAEVIGYYYCPPNRPDQEQAFLASEVSHWAPIPDPNARFRGTTWLSAALREVSADNAMTNHQRKYFEQGATPNIVVTLDPNITEVAYKRWIALMRDETEGIENAYRTMWLGAGAEPHVIGANLESFREVKGHGETRIAAAAGVPPIIVGLSEGLEASTYSNYGQARRHFGDSTLRWLWRTFAQSLEDVVSVPNGSRLWYDLRDVAFMRQDEADAAAIQSTEATSMRQLIDSGFEPQTVVDAILARDWSKLTHSGLYSVQLQPPGTSFKPAKAQPQLPPGSPSALVLPSPAELQQFSRSLARSKRSRNGTH